MVGKAHKSGHFQNVRLDLAAVCPKSLILEMSPPWLFTCFPKCEVGLGYDIVPSLLFWKCHHLGCLRVLTYAKRSIANAKPCNTKVDNCRNHHFFNILRVSVHVFVILFLVAKSLWPPIPYRTPKLWTTKGYKPLQHH
jgi:hypothetical protein